jgi:hypothetical protein
MDRQVITEFEEKYLERLKEVDPNKAKELESSFIVENLKVKLEEFRQHKTEPNDQD